ncbi:MAG: hypothetical protein KatS3mg114_1375 [Planctomycetaceae bacterium]|nr:MAG: hypothetical protein KatS3mg114_1375 [Planctomycetaceae bacterium]
MFTLDPQTQHSRAAEKNQAGQLHAEAIAQTVVAFDQSQGERQEKFRECILFWEPALLTIMRLADPPAYEQLFTPPPDWPAHRPYTPMLHDILTKWKPFDQAPKDIKDSAFHVKSLRNKLSHQAPQLSSREMAEGFCQLWCVILWITKHLEPQLRALTFLLPRQQLLKSIVDRWRQHIEFWIPLDASQQDPDDIFQHTATELVDTPPLADSDDRRDSPDAESSSWEGEHGKVHDLIDRRQKIILVAKPGAGKTTSLQHYAALRAQELLANPHRARPIPLYYALRYYQGDLFETLQEHAQEPNPSRFSDQLRNGRWLLLLDGFNEVSGSLQEGLLRELEQLVPLVQGVVITSRPDERLRQLGLPVFELNRLTQEQIQQYLHRHIKTPNIRERFLQTLHGNQKLWEWAHNPLQLWMLTQIAIKMQGEFPQNRGELLKRFIDYILKREMTKSQQTPHDVKCDLLAEIAYQTRERQTVSFERSYAWEIVREHSSRRGYSVDSAQFVREVCDNHLLVESDHQLTFSHEMYQEYFAALRLQELYSDDPSVIGKFDKDPWWHEPIVLMYGLLRLSLRANTPPRNTT